MIDAACNYINPFATATLTNSTGDHPTSIATTSSFIPNSNINEFTATNSSSIAATAFYKKAIIPAATVNGGCNVMKMEVQYPPQASSTGSMSPNSSVQSAPSSASVSPNIFPLPAQTFSSISASPPTAVTAPASQPFPGSHSELGAAAAAAASAYSWNTAAYTTALPTRSQFPYAQYASDYYGNVGMPASAGPWFSHQDRLYQSWSGQTYANFNFDDIAFQTQLQRRSVRCTCPNCTNEMSGLPPIVGPDERGRKQHICHIPGCERLYGKASHLKTHLRWHTGERPFLCLTCGKRFSRSDELQRHGRTHTNYRPYACPICSKKFSRSDHLSKHKKTHFKDKKNKKAMASDVKEQNVVIKQEKSQNAGHEKKSATSITTTATAASTSKASSNDCSNTIQSNQQSQTQAQSRSQESPSQPSTQLPLKNEHTEIASGYNFYSNLYHQGSALFHPHLNAGSSYCPASSVGTTAVLHQTAPPPTFDLWNSHTNRSTIQDHQLQQPSSGHQHHSIPSTMTSAAAANGTAIIKSNMMTNHSVNSSQRSSNPSSHHHQQHQHQQQQQPQHHNQQHHQQQQQPHRQQHQHKLHNAQVTTPTSAAVTTSEQISQHNSVSALQNESQLVAEYGLALPTNTTSVSSTASVYPHHHSHHSPPIHHSHTSTPYHSTTYTSFIGPMKSEYPSYTTDFSSNSSYSSYSTATSAFHHHHHHNHWAGTCAYQHSHATA